MQLTGLPRVLATLLVLSISHVVLGDISYTVDYTDCYGEDFGETYTDTFTTPDLDTAFMPICQVIWRSSPDYSRDKESWPTKLYCRTIRVQGNGMVDGDAIACDGTVSFPEGEYSGKAVLLDKYTTIRNSCVIS
jgi:hypothetical protein